MCIPHKYNTTVVHTSRVSTLYGTSHYYAFLTNVRMELNFVYISNIDLHSIITFRRLPFVVQPYRGYSLCQPNY